MAGFFDGEGHIRIQRHSKRGNYMLQISVVQATLEPLPLFKEMFGGTVAPRIVKYKDGNKAQYTWQSSSAAAGMALAYMLPHLRVKHDEALVALAFRGTFRPQYGDRSRMDPEVIVRRADMMYELQQMRRFKRERALADATATCAAG